MNIRNTHRLAASALTLVSLFAPLGATAQHRSGTGDIIVMEPQMLPKAAQQSGDSLFLYPTDDGGFYLYVEQQQGARIAVFDVTDPAHIKTLSVTPLTVSGPFDFVQPLGSRAELLRLRDGKGMGVLDLKNSRHPNLRLLPNSVDGVTIEPLGEASFLAVNRPTVDRTGTPFDYRVIDASTPEEPVLRVKQVSHEVSNVYLGTTFLLGSNGLTVVRRVNAEREFATHQQQMSGN